ncbi:hypothetical protein AB4865_03045 [Capnocytophaga sp. ARDL2]|uniref:hypothetical protein n=1 Tax=Capnocytophaga sp. ARDL2 TaxID=3238809 RepID=UPI0035593526
MERESFVIYNASAGAGKTFTLVKEYLKIKVINHTTGETYFDDFFQRNFYHMNWGWHNKGNSYASGNGWYRDNLFLPKYGNVENTLISHPDLFGYDLDGDGVAEGTYHQGYYYNRSMVYDITP